MISWLLSYMRMSCDQGRSVVEALREVANLHLESATLRRRHLLRLRQILRRSSPALHDDARDSQIDAKQTTRCSFHSNELEPAASASYSRARIAQWLAVQAIASKHAPLSDARDRGQSNVDCMASNVKKYEAAKLWRELRYICALTFAISAIRSARWSN
jgi:hypothetical protein